MKISEKKYIQIFNILLLLISLCLPFGKLSNLAIILFALFNIVFNNNKNYKLGLRASLLMLIPLLLEILFFWNNDSFSLGIKSIEKYISLLVFALFLITQYKIINFEKLLKYYSIGMVFIMIFLEIRFVVLFPELADKYKEGRDLWEAGYKLTESFKVHAPALNLQLSFVGCVCAYFFIKAFFNKSSLWIIFSNFLLFILSFLHVLIVNTRMSLVCVLVGVIFILFFEVKKYFSLQKLLVSSLIFMTLLLTVISVYIYNNPFMVEKYTSFTFKNIDKVGRIDELENPEVEAYNSAVTRLSIWKTTIELANQTPVFGVGSSDANPTLFKHYVSTNQKFLSKYNFPVHNQYLNYYLKFGVLGIIGILIYFSGIYYLGIKLKNALIIAFGIIISISNLTDDFLNRFDGIGFASFFYSIIIAYYLKMHFYKSVQEN